MANTKKVKCGKCHKIININNNKSILCDGECENWYHFCCTDLSEKEINEFCENPDKIWFCKEIAVEVIIVCCSREFP